jgi:hypothetical protein
MTQGVWAKEVWSKTCVVWERRFLDVASLVLGLSTPE